MKEVGGLIESAALQPARAARPSRVARNFFSLGALKWSRIALMGSLQISTGSALGKSSMQE